MLREGVVQEEGEESGDGGYADEVSGGGRGTEEGGGSEDEGEKGVVLGVDGEGPEGEGLLNLDGGDGGGEGGGRGLGLAACEGEEGEEDEEWWGVHFGDGRERDELGRVLAVIGFAGLGRGVHI